MATKKKDNLYRTGVDTLSVHTTMVPKTPPAPKAPATPKEQIEELLKRYFGLEDAIHETYLLDGEDEIAIARENLREAFEDVEIPDDIDLQAVQSYIDECSEDDEQAILSYFSSDARDKFVNENLDDVDQSDYLLHSFGPGAIVVKIESLAQREKLEHFLRTEIWPADNQYHNNVIL
jgi:hypothetical protein